jgi:hypothetical protein
MKKKLTKKQKTILLVGVGILGLAIFIATTLVVRKNGSPSASSQPVPLPPPTSLTDQQNQAITEIRNLLAAQSIPSTDLVQKLVEENKLSADQSDWKVYLQDATKEQITNRKEELLTILASLGNQPPTPIPSPLPQPDPDYTPPYTPQPDIRPTEQWPGILWDIRKFMETNPSSLEAIKDWVESQDFPDPFEGINLEGVGMDELKKLPDNGPIVSLSTVNPSYGLSEYKNWVQLSAAGDGNCFLNSFSVLLTGRERDTSLALPLRVKTCLEFMTNPNKVMAENNEAQNLAEMKEKLVGSHGFARNGAWLTNEDISYMRYILERQIILISVVTNTKDWSDYAIKELENNGGNIFVKFPNEAEFNSYEYESLKYKDYPFVIYNSGGHFQPLIEKTKKLDKIY